MMKKEEPFKGLGGILDIIYGALVSFFIYTVGDKYFSLPENSSSFLYTQSIALILITIFMIEDYCSVKLINSIKGYGSTDRFSLDVVIAFLFFFTFQAINYKRTEFIYFIGLIHLFRSFWAFFLRYRKLIGGKYIDYLKLISRPNFILFSICFILAILNKVSKSVTGFDTLLKYYLISYFVILFFFVVIIKFKDIVKVWWTGKKKDVSFRKEIGPILSKFTIFILIFIIILLKTIISFFIHMAKAIISFFIHMVKAIISFLKGKGPPIL